jgi:adenylate kinase family enzyme
LRSCRLLITGASGAGTTALGRALADRWSVPHGVVDDYFWVPTSPPYTETRPVDERLSLMNALFLPRDSWVLSGSLMEWGDSLIERFSAVVFLTLDPSIRMDRLKERETARYGSEFNEAAHREFFDWARGYDDAEFSGRSRARHEGWLALLPCPVFRLDSAEPMPRLLDAVTGWLNSGTVDGRA